MILLIYTIGNKTLIILDEFRNKLSKSIPS